VADLSPLIADLTKLIYTLFCLSIQAKKSPGNGVNRGSRCLLGE